MVLRIIGILAYKCLGLGVPDEGNRQKRFFFYEISTVYIFQITLLLKCAYNHIICINRTAILDLKSKFEMDILYLKYIKGI